MTDSLPCKLVLARALSVEPIARALCPDPCGIAERPFARSAGRWPNAAARAALANSAASLEPAAALSPATRWRPFQAPHLR